jgi:hypothetical protein
MFRFVKYWLCLPALVLPAVLPAWSRDLEAGGESAPPHAVLGENARGQYGGDLRLLRGFCTWPEKGESNFFFDLWEPGNLATFARVHGLTNNHALLIDSHGAEHLSWKGVQFVFQPKVSAVSGGANPPIYSVRDVARVLGRSAADVHNIVVAGCNEGGAIEAAAFRRYFVNVTNVIHMTAGERSYKPQFYQMLIQHSTELEPLFEKLVSMDGREVRSEILRAPVEGSKRLGWYVANLFRPGESKPFRRQRAGRELLDPGFPSLAELRAAELRADLSTHGTE